MRTLYAHVTAIKKAKKENNGGCVYVYCSAPVALANIRCAKAQKLKN